MYVISFIPFFPLTNVPWAIDFKWSTGRCLTSLMHYYLLNIVIKAYIYLFHQHHFWSYQVKNSLSACSYVILLIILCDTIRQIFLTLNSQVLSVSQKRWIHFKVWPVILRVPNLRNWKLTDIESWSFRSSSIYPSPRASGIIKLQRRNENASRQMKPCRWPDTDLRSWTLSAGWRRKIKDFLKEISLRLPKSTHKSTAKSAEYISKIVCSWLIFELEKKNQVWPFELSDVIP